MDIANKMRITSASTKLLELRCTYLYVSGPMNKEGFLLFFSFFLLSSFSQNFSLVFLFVLASYLIII